MKATRTLAIAALVIGAFGVQALAWDEILVTTRYSSPTVVYRAHYSPAPAIVYRPAPVVYYSTPVYVSSYSRTTFVSSPVYFTSPSYAEVTYITRW
jgi:hypothetical protein